MKRKFQLIGYGLIALWTVGPMLLAFTAGGIAVANGCTLNEGSAHPCIVFGKDIGESLYAMGVMGFLAIATIPTGMVMAALFFAFNWWRGKVNARAK